MSTAYEYVDKEFAHLREAIVDLDRCVTDLQQQWPDDAEGTLEKIGVCHGTINAIEAVRHRILSQLGPLRSHLNYLAPPTTSRDLDALRAVGRELKERAEALPRESYVACALTAWAGAIGSHASAGHEAVERERVKRRKPPAPRSEPLECPPNQLRERRLHAGLTQGALADAVGFPVSYVGFWERGKMVIPPDAQGTLAEFFGVTVGELLTPASLTLTVPEEWASQAPGTEREGA